MNAFYSVPFGWQCAACIIILWLLAYFGALIWEARRTRRRRRVLSLDMRVQRGLKAIRDDPEERAAIRAQFLKEWAAPTPAYPVSSRAPVSRVSLRDNKGRFTKKPELKPDPRAWEGSGK